MVRLITLLVILVKPLETLVLSNMSIMPSLPNIFDPNVLLRKGLNPFNFWFPGSGAALISHTIIGKTYKKPKSNACHRYDG